MPQNKRFTVSEIEFIKDNCSKITVEEIAEKLRRSTKGVRGKIERLGIKLSDLPRNQPYFWSKADIETLETNWTLPDHEIQTLLPNFSIAEILRQRLKLGLRKQTYEPYMQGDYLQCFEEGKRVWIHRKVASEKIGRELKNIEPVHHVNGDKLDNNPDNLFVCSDKRHHGIVHNSLEQAAFEFVKRGLIEFNHETGTYFLPE